MAMSIASATTWFAFGTALSHYVEAHRQGGNQPRTPDRKNAEVKPEKGFSYRVERKGGCVGVHIDLSA